MATEVSQTLTRSTGIDSGSHSNLWPCGSNSFSCNICEAGSTNFTVQNGRIELNAVLQSQLPLGSAGATATVVATTTTTVVRTSTPTAATSSPNQGLSESGALGLGLGIGLPLLLAQLVLLFLLMRDRKWKRSWLAAQQHEMSGRNTHEKNRRIIGGELDSGYVAAPELSSATQSPSQGYQGRV